ncbi:MAG: flagellar basal body-associated FliL family protein [Planctomycetota bacterium]
MADEDKKEAEDGAEGADGEESPKKSKKGLILGGGVLGVLGAAYLAATMAVPSPPVQHRFAGPFVSPLSEENISVNLADNDHKRYLRLGLTVEYYSYEADYFLNRTADPLYQPYLMNALQHVTNSRHRSEVSGETNRMIFLEEIAEAIDPVLFPIHIGATTAPFDQDVDSGLKPGYSMSEGTFRGKFHEHLLIVDAVEQTVRIDGGPVVDFEGDETDLEVPDERGRTIYLNVSELTEGYQAEIPVGAHGRVQRILVEDFLIQ